MTTSDRQLSANFRLSEFVRSQTAARRGINNTPAPAVIDRLERLCVELLQPIRDVLGPVHITSGYRSPILNAAIGGSSTSQHCQGDAADFVVTGHTVDDVARWVAESDLPYHQLIHEFGEWVHLSQAPAGDPPRRQVLSAVNTAKGTTYTEGLPA